MNDLLFWELWGVPFQEHQTIPSHYDTFEGCILNFAIFCIVSTRNELLNLSTLQFWVFCGKLTISTISTEFLCIIWLSSSIASQNIAHSNGNPIFHEWEDRENSVPFWVGFLVLFCNFLWQVPWAWLVHTFIILSTCAGFLVCYAHICEFHGCTWCTTYFSGM